MKRKWINHLLGSCTVALCVMLLVMAPAVFARDDGGGGDPAQPPPDGDGGDGTCSGTCVVKGDGVLCKNPDKECGPSSEKCVCHEALPKCACSQ